MKTCKRLPWTGCPKDTGAIPSCDECWLYVEGGGAIKVVVIDTSWPTPHIKPPNMDMNGHGGIWQE